MRRGLAIPTVALCCGCGATLTLSSGEQVHGKIEGNDRTRIRVRTDSGERQVCKREVRDIDHPGDIAILAGGVLAAIGGYLIYTTATVDSDDQSGQIPLSYGIGAAAGGLALGIWGTSKYFGSKGAADHPPAEDVSKEPCESSPGPAKAAR
jgi:hypothetical protein